MGKIYGHYEWDDSVGSPGRREDGSLHQNLYNEDRVLAGHARFVPDNGRLDEEDECSYENTFFTSEYRRESEEVNELAQSIGVLLAQLTMIGIAKAAPHARKWWHGRARPVVGRQAQKIRNLGSKKKSEVEDLEPAEDEHAALEVDRRPVMSREEAMSRMIAGLAASAYSDEQMRMIKSSRIVGVDDYTEIEKTVAQIPSEQLQTLVLEMVKNPALLKDGSLANLASVLTPSGSLLELRPISVHREDPEP
ncbi:hypothetical protein M0E87_12260 [Corynebacterium sp. CCM 9185]|uniref:Uncharacterized protein n=1 Tax=Corynebacterium marambiense TaxID=2765364 RepID=A0ABS0VX56_9CORY|nr:hypothetical protein [Corynebacterium marambiense]MBI9001360.1 hypothetical protein [Corynebacterium marambiense]MCK7664416.1 hypothetical protein [Corynebacterium marambiense]